MVSFFVVVEFFSLLVFSFSCFQRKIKKSQSFKKQAGEIPPRIFFVFDEKIQLKTHPVYFEVS